MVAGCGSAHDSEQVLPTSRAQTTASTITTGTAVDVDELGDGTHQVRVDSADLVGGSVTLDGVQVFTGMDAVLAYLADTDGAQLEGPQFYVRNGTSDPQEFPVDAAGEFSVIAAEACCEAVDVGWSGLASAVAGDFTGIWGGDPPFTAVIDNGVVVSLEQIYIP